jgi:hypothetical protein
MGGQVIVGHYRSADGVKPIPVAVNQNGELLSGGSAVTLPGGGDPVAAPADFRTTGYDDYTTPGVVVFYAESASQGKTYTKTIDKTAQPRTFGEWVEDAP